MGVEQIFEKFALGVEAAAIAVILFGFVIKLLRKQSAIETFRKYRHGLGRTLLLSLELLVAADIVRDSGIRI